MDRADALKTIREIRRLKARILRSPRSFLSRLRRGYVYMGIPTNVGLRVAAPFRSLFELLRWGPRIRRQWGTPLARQLVDMLHISLRWRHAPRLYYVWELFRDGRMADAPYYVDTMQNVEIQYAAMPRIRGDSRGGKVDFHRRCGKFGLRTVPVLATCAASWSEPDILDGDSPEWEGDLYEKPARGSQGKGIRRWRRQEDGSWTCGSTRARDRGELLALVSDAARKDIHMLQPRRHNHPDLDWVRDGPISTIRITTLRPVGGGRVEYMRPVMRIPREGAWVDNVHQGGFPAPVDVATGTIQPMRNYWGLSDGMGTALHPDTDRPVAGVVVPFWPEALELCREAQEAFASRPSVGWDVGIDAEGPFLLEMNGMWGCDLMQVPPFGLSPFAEIMLQHLRVQAGIRR
jgi:hypothetical protein